MSQATIFYFTGTGNSLVVARALAARIGASLVPVTSTIGQASVESDAEVVGFVFPLYDFKPPKIMEELVGKLASIDTKYLFAACTYRIAAGQSLKRFGKTVEEHGGLWAAAKLLRIYLLMYGKRPRLRELVRALRAR